MVARGLNKHRNQTAGLTVSSQSMGALGHLARRQVTQRERRSRAGEPLLQEMVARVRAMVIANSASG